MFIVVLLGVSLGKLLSREERYPGRKGTSCCFREQVSVIY